MKRLYPLLIIFAVVFLLYHPVLTTYFSQDDFFHFKVSQTDGSLKGFINLFGFHPFEERGIAFYRPIFREVLFNSFYSIFGLNHIPFRILSFGIHFLNIYLVYIFMQRLFPKKIISIFIAFFFGISSAHIASLYYLAGGIQSLGATTFIFLTLIFFQNFLKNKNTKYKFLSFITFLLALGSHELAVILPFLLIGLITLYVPKVRQIIKLWPYFLVIFIYLYLDITKIGFSSGELQYQTIFNPKTVINSFVWYAGWAVGLPEMLLDFVLPGLRLNPTLMRYWGNYFLIIFITFFISVIILGGSLIYLIRKGQIFQEKKFWFFLIWFPLGIIPVIFLPSHKSTYYLTPVLPAFWAIVAYLIFQIRLARFLVIAFCLTAFILSITSINLGHSTYWAAQRGRLAKKLIDQAIITYPSLPKGSAIYFTNDPNYPFVAQDWGGSSKQASFVLNGADALQLLYQDPTLQVFYEDLEDIPRYFPKNKVYAIVARIN